MLFLRPLLPANAGSLIMRMRMKWINYKITTFSLVFLSRMIFCPLLLLRVEACFPMHSRVAILIPRHGKGNTGRQATGFWGYVSIAFVLWAVIALKTRSFLPVFPKLQFLFSPGSSGSGDFTLFFSVCSILPDCREYSAHPCGFPHGFCPS